MSAERNGQITGPIVFCTFVTCPQEKNGFHCANKGCRKKANAHRLPIPLWPNKWLHQTQLEDPKAPATQNPLIGGLMMRCLYMTPAAWGVPTTSERGAESEVAHKWAKWLHDPCRPGGSHPFRVGGRIRGGQQVGRVAT